MTPAESLFFVVDVPAVRALGPLGPSLIAAAATAVAVIPTTMTSFLGVHVIVFAARIHFLTSLLSIKNFTITSGESYLLIYQNQNNRCHRHSN
jgi:hypothetical protein